MDIVFMGTPDFAAGALEALAGEHRIVLVVTQPDRPKGRSGRPVFSPVKEKALALGLPVYQPERIKRPEAVEFLAAQQAEIFVVATYGQILSRAILDIPPKGCVNIHASLLPRHRGASPIQHALLAGDARTGITIMAMDEGLDTGHMLYKLPVDIEEGDNFASLHDKLQEAGARAILEALAGWEGLVPQPQDHAQSTYAPLLEKSMGHVEVAAGVGAALAKIRAFSPWPGAFVRHKGRMVKLLEARRAPEAGLAPAGSPGRVELRRPGGLYLDCGDGYLEIQQLQPEGKRPLLAREFLAGLREDGPMLWE